MNFIVISPHFPTNYQTFSVRLNEAGITTLGIADEPYENLPDTLKESLTEYYRVDNMLDYDQMYRAVAYFAHKYGKIDRIESHNEFWLENDAHLRTDFNVMGLKLADMERLKYKSKMKEVFRTNGVPVASGRVFTDYEAGLKLANELGYPVVVKPNSGVGASNTYKINDEEHLKEIFAQLDFNIEHIMEEYIPGDIVTFDGLTDQDGNIVFSSTLVYNLAVLDVVSGDSNVFFYIPREIPKDIQELGEKCVKAFGIKERFFHFEFFRLKSDQSLMGLEINCRPPGGSTIDMFNYANNFDIFKEYANVVLHNHFDASVSRQYFCAYISRKLHYNYVHSEQELYSRYGEYIISEQRIPGVFSAIMGNIGFILRTETEEKLNELIHFIHEIE